jgi:hypothetical protein
VLIESAYDLQGPGLGYVQWSKAATQLDQSVQIKVFQTRDSAHYS